MSQNNKEISPKPDHLYRFGVGIVLVNDKKEIFAGKRIDNKSDTWQMPQGGIDNNENEDLAVIRELEEETGINKSKVKILEKTKKHLYYNLPYKLQKKFWGGKYLGQRQRWYLAQFTGQDSDINIATEDPEFSQWKWINKDDILSHVVNFKQQMYADIFEEFENFFK